MNVPIVRNQITIKRESAQRERVTHPCATIRDHLNINTYILSPYDSLSCLSLYSDLSSVEIMALLYGRDRPFPPLLSVQHLLCAFISTLHVMEEAAAVNTALLSSLQPALLYYERTLHTLFYKCRGP